MTAKRVVPTGLPNDDLHLAHLAPAVPSTQLFPHTHAHYHIPAATYTTTFDALTHLLGASVMLMQL